MAPRSESERDAMTVEIGFAFFSALFLAGCAALLPASPIWFLGLEGTAARAVGLSAATGAGALWIWRVARVLLRFDSRRA
ncbi:DUF6332 family protein [Streptomyces hoynatensis]|uniref:Uncharacterized protein n=1 Tax=Streptomyces hoynatensis TaxID=1141874 RepID=A0A3A9YSD9_9ACTN|nr:DUF6332 family protein [Streptomyces hoynatensis]RKN38968.1 hypothetical protein D7294_22535 [Streptomyces hoynatensis]